MQEPPPTITSPANPTVKMLKSLALRKHRATEGLFLVEGPRHIAEALQGGHKLALLVHDAAFTPPAPLTEVAPRTLPVAPEILQRITNRANAQPVLAAFQIPENDLTLAQSGLWVALHEIRDPGNLGTIIRTADATGAAGLILIGDCCDPYQPETVRATMGAFARVPAIRTDETAFTRWRQNWPAPVIGTHLHEKSVDYRTPAYPETMLLLMGGESSGLPASLTALCDELVKIPMRETAESLNLAVSTALMLYETRRARL